MTPSVESQWGAEIREFLVAVMSRQRTVGFLTQPAWQSASPSPIGRWSILEGKVYPSIGGNFVEKLDEALRLIELVDRTFNPRMRLSERMEGPVDWGATLSRRPFGIVPEYVIRSSGIGLSEDERCALWGWVGWIADKASIYGLEDDAGNLVGGGWSFLWKKEALCRLRNLATDPRCKWAYGRGGDLRRWSHVARRSRWPLLRDLVAESLRIELEPWSIEKIPLPEKRERLFDVPQPVPRTQVCSHAAS